MAIVISSPQTLSFSANVAPLVVAATTATSFVLKKNGVEILNEMYYPDNTGKFNVELKEIIDAVLLVSIPTGIIFTQINAVATFTIYINNVLQCSFDCVKSGIDGNPPSAINFFKANFLTWQPQELKVKYDDPQYLTYYATEIIIVKLNFFYFQSGVIASHIAHYGSFSAGDCYTFNMKYSYLRSKCIPTSLKPSFIEVWVENTSGVRLSYKQRYQLQDDYDRFDDLFLFENSLGGIDVIRFNGWMQGRDDHKISSAVFNGHTKEYDLEYMRIFSKNTGYISSETYRKWALDFFSCINRYHISEGQNKQIVLPKFETKNTKGELNDFSFEFYYSDKDKYESYSRLAALPSVEDDEMVIAPDWVNILPPVNPYSFNASFSKSFRSFNYAKSE
ncbi:MAG: hypothetical protein ACOYO1_12805 [Bacteroidales bacterium]